MKTSDLHGIAVLGEDAARAVLELVVEGNPQSRIPFFRQYHGLKYSSLWPEIIYVSPAQNHFIDGYDGLMGVRFSVSEQHE